MFFETQQPDAQHPADRRTVPFERDPAAIQAAWDAGEAWKEAELAFAKTLAVVEEGRSYRELGCASLAQWTARLGLAAEETRRLLALGQAIAAQPSVEERVRAKALTASAAAAVAPMLSEERAAAGVPLYSSAWTDRAESVGLTRLRRDVREEMARRRCGESVVCVEMHVTETVREDLERARAVASRKEGRFLTRDETLGVVLAHYLKTFDPLCENEGTRRVGATEDRPEDRYIPVAVRRAIRRRAGDCCEVPGCEEHIDLEFAHRTPHRAGSGREEKDLFLVCWLHHAMLDQGLLLVLGPTANPAWIDGWGTVLTKQSPEGREPRSEAECEASRAQEAKRGWNRPTASPPAARDHDDGGPDKPSLVTVQADVAAAEADPAPRTGDLVASTSAAPRAPPGRARRDV